MKALGPHCQGQTIESPRIQAIGDTLPYRRFGSCALRAPAMGGLHSGIHFLFAGLFQVTAPVSERVFLETLLPRPTRPFPSSTRPAPRVHMALSIHCVPNPCHRHSEPQQSQDTLSLGDPKFTGSHITHLVWVTPYVHPESRIQVQV